MRVLVTGADGFVARHLIPHLREGKHEVVGTVLDPRAGAAESSAMYPLDITDQAAAGALFTRVQPTHVVHLAAVSNVPWSRTHPEETTLVNVTGTQNILDAAAALPVPCRVLVVGSAEEYGPNSGTPITELPISDLRPLSPYAESKVAVERLVEEQPAYRELVIRTRSFPHIGPAQRKGFFVADVASQLVAIERRTTPPVLLVGNLEPVRDYTDVRDVVRAYGLLLEQGVPGQVYNVCSGRGWSIQALLDTLVSAAGVSVRVEQDPAKLRPADIPVLAGDNAKLRAATGWAPKIPLEKTIRDVLAWWRAQPA